MRVSTSARSSIGAPNGVTIGRSRGLPSLSTMRRILTAARQGVEAEDIWHSIGHLQSQSESRSVLVDSYGSPSACTAIARKGYLRRGDERNLQIAQFETYAGHIFDERALPYRLRADCYYLRQAEFECSPTVRGEISIVRMDSPRYSRRRLTQHFGDA
jgi:hypothetical protein